MMDRHPTLCPCGSGRTLAACCGRYVGTGEPAPDAKALMRSRYTAFTLGHAAHLRDTWHPSTRPATLDLEADRKWLGLEVRAHAADPADPDRASVEFVARSRHGGRGARLHEISEFRREGGRWFYLRGRILSPAGRSAEPGGGAGGATDV